MKSLFQHHPYKMERVTKKLKKEKKINAIFFKKKMAHKSSYEESIIK